MTARRSRVREAGRTRILSTRERLRVTAVAGLTLVGAAGCLWVAAAVVSLVRGDGWQWPEVTISLGVGGGLAGSLRDRTVQAAPLTITWPAPFGVIAATATPLWTMWIVVAVRPVGRKLHYEPRLLWLASANEIAAVLGARAVRRSGAYSLTETTGWSRRWLPDEAFGMRIGVYLNPHTRTPARPAVWAEWERRLRIIARTGWGKTTRLLIPIARALPGSALITTTEPGLFQATVLARMRRTPLVRWPRLAAWARRLGARRTYPVEIFDLSAPDIRFSQGFPAAHWGLIRGCERADVAMRRAKTLVQGVDAKDHRKGSETDIFFRDSSQAVLAAWLHACALDGRGVADLSEWLRNTTTPVPRRILANHPHAERSMLLDLDKHLDPRAGRTTSGVERYIMLALSSVITGEGRRITGASPELSLDFEDLIRRRGTVYILCDEEHAARYRPLMGLLASEWYLAAEAVALASRRRRLPVPAVGLHDELRYGVPLPILPYVANTGRKYGIGFAYSVQSAAHEEEIFGGQADGLRAAAGMTITGGLDMASSQDLVAQAGRNPVVLASQGSHRNEVVQESDTWRVADMQTLADGEAVITVPGLRPFLAYCPSYRENTRLRRMVAADIAELDRLADASRAAA